MTKTPVLAVRGKQCGILSRDRRTVAVLRRQLDLLGMQTIMDRLDIADGFDACYVDVDTVFEDSGASFVAPKAPIIAIVGTETPGRLEWMLRFEPASVLMKPLGSHGIYTALVLAFHEAQRRERENQRVFKLEERVRSRRIVVAALIRMMQQYGIDEPEAFALLRNAAQQRRMTIEALSAEIEDNGILPVRMVASR